MLKLKHSHQLHLPHLALPTVQARQLSPGTIDDRDELAAAIANDPVTHDNNWVLTDTPDQAEIEKSEKLWDEIVEDVRHDPEWFNFSAEDE